jgi:hypothetical protein
VEYVSEPDDEPEPEAVPKPQIAKVIMMINYIAGNNKPPSLFNGAFILIGQSVLQDGGVHC